VERFAVAEWGRLAAEAERFAAAEAGRFAVVGRARGQARQRHSCGDRFPETAAWMAGWELTRSGLRSVQEARRHSHSKNCHRGGILFHSWGRA